MCPACNEPMIVVEFQGMELDHCSSCGGSWFDAGELEFLFEHVGVTRGALDAALRRDAAKTAAGSRRCPRCGARMTVVHAGPQQKIQIDRCPRGDGIWLDRGELGRLVSMLSDSPAAAIAAYLGDLFRHELAAGVEDKQS